MLQFCAAVQPLAHLPQLLDEGFHHGLDAWSFVRVQKELFCLQRELQGIAALQLH